MHIIQATAHVVEPQKTSAMRPIASRIQDCSHVKYRLTYGSVSQHGFQNNREFTDDYSQRQRQRNPFAIDKVRKEQKRMPR